MDFAVTMHAATDALEIIEQADVTVHIGAWMLNVERDGDTAVYQTMRPATTNNPYDVEMAWETYRTFTTLRSMVAYICDWEEMRR